MIALHVLTLITSPAPSPSIIVLQPVEEPVREGCRRVVPIWIGFNEATNLGMALEKVQFSRPTTHDLFLNTLTNLDAKIDHVLINDMKGHTFFAQLVLNQHGRLISLDARPSDALTLAIRQDASLYIESDVLERASFPYLYKKQLDDDKLFADFHKFIETVMPDDFKE